MVIDGAPGTVGVCGYAEEALPVGVFTAAGCAGTGLSHISGLGIPNINGTGVLVLNSAQEPVGKILTSRVLSGGSCGLDFGGQDLTAQFIIQSGFQHQCHVFDRTVMVLVIEPHAVGEV